MFNKEEQKEFYNNLGQAIRKARQIRNVSQEDLAKYLDLSRVSVVNIEKGRQKVQVHTLLEIGKYLGISIDGLLDSSPQKKIDKAIIKQIDPEKISEVEKIRQFVSSTLSKNIKN